MPQSELGAYNDATDRPAGEAEAVAGGAGGATATAGDATDPLPEAEGHLEFAVSQVNYTIAERAEGEVPLIHVFGRTADRERVHVEVRGFRPYFYAPTADVSEADLEDRVITGAEPGYESIRGEELTRIYARTPRDVGDVRDRFQHFEADVPFPNRFLIDRGLRSGIRVPNRHAGDRIVVTADEVAPADVTVTPRVHMVDLEVDDRAGFPEDGEQPIICLTSHDSYADEYMIWLFVAPNGEGDRPAALPDHDLLHPEASVEVRRFDTEEAMLDDYLDYVTRTNPDLISGWNVDEFDAPYLLDRLEELDPDTEVDLSIDRLSPVDEVWRDNWRGPNVKGRVVFDLLYGYRRTQFTELESYRLEAVGEEEVGVSKERYTGKIGDLWEQDPERLLEYNLRDVELCVEIDRRQAVIAFWNEVRRFVGCKLEDAPTPGDTVDVYVLHKVHGEFVLPSRGQVEGEDYEGGAVFDPITGIREMVSVLDLRSLYPMCMVTINASPETKVDPSEFDGETYPAPNGTHFRKEPDGIIREMVDELLAEREQKKDLRDDHAPDSDAYHKFDRQQQAVKVLMNSLYGVLGWDRFRLYDREMGAAVTATGREALQFTEQSANELGHGVVYGDSVTGDRPVVVRDPAGRVRVLPIERFFEMLIGAEDQQAEPQPRPAHAPGQGKERYPVTGWEALSLSNDGQAEWQPVEYIVRHQTRKPVVNLQHTFGESTTTADHSYVVEGEETLVEKRPGEIDAPLRIPGIPDVETEGTIDVLELLAGDGRLPEDGSSGGRENAAPNVNGVHADEEVVWLGRDGQNDQDRTIRVNRFIEVGSDACEALLRLLGAYIANGSASPQETTDPNNAGASIAAADRTWLDGVRQDCNSLFDEVAVSITPSDQSSERVGVSAGDGGTNVVSTEDQSLKLQLRNERAAVFFRKVVEHTAHRKRIPPFLIHLPDREQEIFLQALVVGDGSQDVSRDSDEFAERNFDFETTSREVAAGLSMLLTQRGQKYTIEYPDHKDCYTIRACDSYGEGHEPVRRREAHIGYVYDLSVTENENFVDAVGGIVLHNTDSVMLELGSDVDKQEAIERSFDIEAHINDSYDEFAADVLNAAAHRFEIEFEKLYRRFFQAGKKKRYAGYTVWSEGKDVEEIDITGFEYQRSDIAQITKEVQHEVIEMIVTGADLDEVKAYLAEVIQEVLEGDVDPEEIGIPGGIGKRLDNYETDTAHVRGAKYANLLLGTNFGRGAKPKRYYLKDVHPEFFERVETERGLDPRTDHVYGEFKTDPDVICVEYADEIPAEFEIDYEKMLDKTLKGPISRVLQALDVSWEEIKSGQEQTGLGQFY